MFKRWLKPSVSSETASTTSTASSDSLIKFSNFDYSVSASQSGISGQVEIYLNRKLKGYYAVKSYNKRENYESKQDFVSRILHEYNILLQTDHINIIKVYHYEVSLLGNVKLFLEAGSDNLYMLMKKNKLSQQDEILCIWKQVLAGITYLHSQGICHRDLKLQNVVLDLSLGHVKIIDFVTAFKPNHQEFAVGLVGSENYSSPEQFGQISYDGFKSDIWSLAICLYQLLTRRLPWKSSRFNDPGYLEYTKRNFDPRTVLRIPDLGKEVVSQMLDIVPELRIDVARIANNPWVESIGYCNGIDSCGIDHMKLIPKVM